MLISMLMFFVCEALLRIQHLVTFGIYESRPSFEGKFGQNLEFVKVSHELNRDLWQGECVTEPHSAMVVILVVVVVQHRL